MQTYAISASMGGTKPNIPNVSYGGLRGGLALKLKIFGPVAFHAQVAATYLLSKGEIATYFPNLSAGSLDAGGGLSATLFDRIEIRLAGEYQRRPTCQVSATVSRPKTRLIARTVSRLNPSSALATAPA